MKQISNHTETQCNEFIQNVAQAAAFMKTVTAIGNNAAWMACLDAFDHIKLHPAYRQAVKSAYKKCFNLFYEYERQLLFDDHLRFFHLDDCSPEIRKTFGIITDRDYYDYWAGFGFNAYTNTKPFYTCLVNKIRLAYIKNNAPNPDILAWSMAAKLCLKIACILYNDTIRILANGEDWKHIGMNEKTWRKIFRPFNISSIEQQWGKAHLLLANGHALMAEPVENRNMQLGFEQLAEKWASEDVIFGSGIKASEDFAEIFRTNGELKKTKRKFAELRNATSALK